MTESLRRAEVSSVVREFMSQLDRSKIQERFKIPMKDLRFSGMRNPVVASIMFTVFTGSESGTLRSVSDFCIRAGYSVSVFSLWPMRFFREESYRDGYVTRLRALYGPSYDELDSFVKENIKEILARDPRFFRSITSRRTERLMWANPDTKIPEGIQDAKSLHDYVGAKEGFQLLFYLTTRLGRLMPAEIQDVTGISPHLLYELATFVGVVSDEKPHDTALKQYLENNILAPITSRMREVEKMQGTVRAARLLSKSLERSINVVPIDQSNTPAILKFKDEVENLIRKLTEWPEIQRKELAFSREEFDDARRNVVELDTQVTELCIKAESVIPHTREPLTRLKVQPKSRIKKPRGAAKKSVVHGREAASSSFDVPRVVSELAPLLKNPLAKEFLNTFVDAIESGMKANDGMLSHIVFRGANITSLINAFMTKSRDSRGQPLNKNTLIPHLREMIQKL